MSWLLWMGGVLLRLREGGLGSVEGWRGGREEGGVGWV